jgi:DNA-directed RNA polymerase specialized sigma24 family protein
MSEPGDITRSLDRLAEGDDAAAEEIWKTYFGRLTNLARRKLEAMPRRIADEEDVALSAMHSFCKGMQAGRFPNLADRDELWKLLVTITIRKAYGQLRHGKAEKRGGGSVRGESVFLRTDDFDSDAGGLAGAAVSEPTPEMVNMLAENCERLLSDLGDEQLREIARYKLEGYTNDEIAEKIGIVRRSVERKLARIRDKWGSAEDAG